MANESDIVSIDASAQLDTAANTGRISLSTRLRALAAIDRLIGGLFDLPAAKIDARIDEIKHEAELKRKYREAQNKAALEALEAGDHEKARQLSFVAASNIREFEKTINLAAVAKEAVLLLTDQSAVSDDDVEGDIESDWLNRFRHFAEEASSDEMRALWARVLSGETRKPGSFSASSLRFVFELDSHLARICESYAHNILDGMVLVREEEKRGAPLDEALALQSSGLLSGVGGNLSRNTRTDPLGGFAYVGRMWGLTGKLKAEGELRIDAWLVTRVGGEIFSLLDSGDESAKYRKLGQLILSRYADQLEKLDLIRVSPETGSGQRLILSNETLLV